VTDRDAHREAVREAVRESRARNDGDAILSELAETITAYVAMPSDEATVAVALWTAATHAQECWQHATRLVMRSPQKRCAKSRLMDVVSGASRKAIITVNASTAAIFRSIDENDPPTLFVDEADTIFGKRQTDTTEDLRGLLDAGFGRGRPALRCVGPKQEPTFFATFAMACLAAIGDTIPDTITDRAVVVTMRRRLPGEQVLSYREGRDRPAIQALGDEVGAWIRGNLDTLRDADPDLPVIDRAADVWSPLVAVADLAGGSWPERARNAATVFTAEADADAVDESLSIRLLMDLQTVFTEPVMSSRDLVAKLRAIDSAPWDQFDFKPRDLARRLHPYGVRPDRVRPDGQQVRGYQLEDLTDTFARYIPPPDLPGPSHSVTTSHETAVTDSDASTKPGGNGHGQVENLDFPVWEPEEAES
jgi:hypothetical protein